MPDAMAKSNVIRKGGKKDLESEESDDFEADDDGEMKIDGLTLKEKWDMKKNEVLMHLEDAIDNAF